MAVSPVLSRLNLGAELRRLREAANITVKQAAEELDCSASKISRIETGVTAPRRPEIDTLLRLYGNEALDVRDDLVQLASESKQAAWYDEYGDLLASNSLLHRYIGLENGATIIRSYSAGAIPGLLQTEDYARAVIQASRPGRPPDEVDRMVRLRMDRKGVLSRNPEPLRLFALLDESVIRRPAHGPGVMSQQLDELSASVVGGSPNVEVRLLPFSAGLHGLLGGTFEVLSFDDGEDAVVFFEGHEIGMLQNKPDVVLAHSERLDTAWKQSLVGRELAQYLKEVSATFR